ncbi:MAG: hypothetical protein COZ31_06895, partial [Nitrospirae bacterium CG_4_10_14_3_um_filter_44_29]
MDDSENDKLIVRNVHALLPSVSKQIAITNKLLAKIDNLEKWWEELEPAWQEIFLRELKINSEDVTLETVRRVRNFKGLGFSDTGITTLEPLKNLT